MPPAFNPRLLMSLTPIMFLYMEYLSPMLKGFIDANKRLDKFNMLHGDENRDIYFDFIIVGAGSSGCHLANKLSEFYRVLVLDVGGEPSPLQNLPAYGFLLNNQKPVDWAHRTVPQTHAAFGLNNNVSNWPQGKVLGGSSSINGLIYLRGNVQGFDLIANKTGDPKWRMNNILRYFRSTEDYRGWHPGGGHGRGGRMSIEKGYLMPFTRILFAAGLEMGFPTRDTNSYGPYTDGMGPMEYHMRDGRRADAFHEALAPVLHRKNLVLRRFSYVTKILMDGNTAKGVEYFRHGKWFRAFANKEVILAAGSLNSAKLLMLSGIGPRRHLQEVGIPTIVDLPVGQRLQDKYGALVGPFIVNRGMSFNRDRDITVGGIARWVLSGKGSFRSGRSEATHAYTSSVARRLGRGDAPDIHTYVLSISADSRMELDFQKAFNFNPASLWFYGSSRGKDSFLQEVTLARSFGHGYMKLRDANPFSTLIIDPRYLHDRRDVEALTEGIRFAVGLVDNTEAFRKIKGHLSYVPYPGCEHFIFKSNAYFECLARHVTITAYKYTGTAPIGRDRNDPEAVVDSDFRVLGINRLRVIDGSIFQLKYSSENDATCRILGEFGGDIILDYWRTR